MMVKKIVATVIYNIAFWGIFLTYQLDLSPLVVLLYPYCMPLLFHLIYFVVIPKKDMETKWRVFQVFIQIMITVVSVVIVLYYIELNFGSGGFMQSGSGKFFRAFYMGIMGTIVYIPIRIGTAFLE